MAFRTKSDVGYETVQLSYDVKLRHFARHTEQQSQSALQNYRQKAKLLGSNCAENISVNCLCEEMDKISYDNESD